MAPGLLRQEGPPHPRSGAAAIALGHTEAARARRPGKFTV
jgi:hypothetical protein